MKKRRYAIRLLHILNERNNTSFGYADYRAMARFMDKKTREGFHASGGFSIPGEGILGLVLTSKSNKNLRGLVRTQSHEYYHLMKDNNCDKADEYAKNNRDKYYKLVRWSKWSK